MTQTVKERIIMLIIKLALRFGLFCLGVWLFNHLSIPFIGIIVALAAVFDALLLIIKFFKGNNHE